MKNLLFVSALLFASILQLDAMNNVKTSALDVIENEKSVVLNIQTKTTGLEYFTITDSKGNVLINETLESRQNSVKYNLSKLPIGRYTIKIDGINFVEFHETLISQESLVVERVETFYRPTIKVANNKVIVDAVLADKEDIRMNIYDANGILIYDFDGQKTGGFQKAFNVEKLEEGRYSVVLSTDYFSERSEFSL